MQFKKSEASIAVESCSCPLGWVTGNGKGDGCGLGLRRCHARLPLQTTARDN